VNFESSINNAQYTAFFKRGIKKYKNRKDLIEIKRIILNIRRDPMIGDLKNVDLKGIRAYEFFLDKVRMKVVYSFVSDEKTVYFLAFGSHSVVGDKYETIKSSLSNEKKRFFAKNGK
jgi:mRNA-degrading endonuclease YafQ of YafQ-DinJ toxin-antitoxin module